MALIADISFSKKIPVKGEQFSSQGYSLTLRTEIAETAPAAIQARLHETFELVKNQVEHELANGNGKPKLEVHDRQRDAGATSPNSPAKASNRQIKFITDLANRQGIALSDLNGRIRERFGLDGLYDLDKRQASTVLDLLKGVEKKAA
jgi:hypothetical protein